MVLSDVRGLQTRSFLGIPSECFCGFPMRRLFAFAYRFFLAALGSFAVNPRKGHSWCSATVANKDEYSARSCFFRQAVFANNREDSN